MANTAPGGARLLLEAVAAWDLLVSVTVAIAFAVSLQASGRPLADSTEINAAALAAGLALAAANIASLAGSRTG